MPTDTTADFQTLNLTAQEMNGIAEKIARRVFYDVLKDNYGAEFADIVSDAVYGGNQE